MAAIVVLVNDHSLYRMLPGHAAGTAAVLLKRFPIPSLLLLASLAGAAWSLTCVAQDSPLLPVTDELSSCQVSSDCVSVYTRCDSCGCPEAISTTFRDRHEQALQTLCAACTGPHCDRLCPLELPECVEGQCMMVPR